MHTDDFRPIVEAHAKFVWRSLRFLGVQASDLPDIAQEVFLVVHRRMGQRDSRTSLRSWIYGICLNVARAYRRRAFRRHEIPVEKSPDEVDGRDPEALLLASEKQKLLAWALDRVGDDVREVFVLVEVEQVSVQDVAQLVGCSVSTVYNRLQSAKDQLRKILQQTQRIEVSVR